MSILSKIARLVLVGGLLAACQAPKSESSQLASSSSSSTQEMVADNGAAGNFVEGNDELGYITFPSKVLPFTDLNHNAAIANTKQWTNPETLSILSLTSYAKKDYTEKLKELTDKQMSETDLMLALQVDAFSGVEGADIALERDLFNDLFHESSISRVILPNGALIVSVSFVPTANSEKIYLLSTEGSDLEEVLSWLGEVLPTWTAQKPA